MKKRKLLSLFMAVVTIFCMISFTSMEAYAATDTVYIDAYKNNLFGGLLYKGVSVNGEDLGAGSDYYIVNAGKLTGSMADYDTYTADGVTWKFTKAGISAIGNDIYSLYYRASKNAWYYKYSKNGLAIRIPVDGGRINFFYIKDESVTPTPSPSASVTPSPSESATPSPSESVTPSPRESVTPSPSES